MKLEIIEIECISMYSNSCIFHAFLENFKSYEFLEFLTKFRFFGFGSNSKIAKNAKKSLFGQKMTFIGIKLLTLTLCNCQ